MNKKMTDQEINELYVNYSNLYYKCFGNHDFLIYKTNDVGQKISCAICNKYILHEELNCSSNEFNENTLKIMDHVLIHIDKLNKLMVFK